MISSVFPKICHSPADFDGRERLSLFPPTRTSSLPLCFGIWYLFSSVLIDRIQLIIS